MNRKLLMHILISKKKLCSILIVFFVCLANLNSQNLFFEKITGRDINPVTQIHGIVKDSVGYIWIGSWNGAYRYDGRTFDFYNHNPNDKTSLPNNRIRNIACEKKLGLWFLTFDNKYVKFNYLLDSFETIDSAHVPPAIVNKLATNANLKSRIINKKKYYISNHHFTSKDLLSGKDYSYTANINHPGQLLDDYVTDFFVDDQNIIWLGTRAGDVYKANPKRNPFELHYSFRKGSENTKLSIVRAITKCNDKVWLGTDEGILIYNKNNELDSSNPFYVSDSKIKNVRTLYTDAKGIIWIGSTTGLEYYNPKTNRCTSVINNLLSPKLETWSVFALEPSGSKSLWVGLYNAIGLIDIEDGSIRYFDLSKVVKNHTVMDILSVHKNQLWLATEGSGVIILKLNSKGEINNTLYLNTFQKPNYYLSGNIIYALHRDITGSIWAGTSEGLNKIRTSGNKFHIEKIPLSSEIFNSYISSISDDSKGNLWIAHKQGISIINILNNKISNYQKEDRFGSWTFSERAVYKDLAEQQIYFGDKNGYVVFNPDKIKPVEVSNKPIFKSLFLSNEKVIPMRSFNGKNILSKDLSQTQKIKLDYENRNFSIEIASLNYSRTNKEIFEYRLDGYEDQWIKTSGNKITYNNILPGTYIFKCRIASSEEKKFPIETLEIIISPPWYETWFAKTIFLIVITGIIYWIFKEILYRDRLKNEIKSALLDAQRQKELDKEKMDFFTNISHDLKTPLTLISDPIKQLENRNLSENEKVLYFSIINRNLNYLTKLITQILDFRKSEIGKLKLNLSIHDHTIFIEECFAPFKYIFEKRSIIFQLHAFEAPFSVYFDAEKVEQILTNIISNSLKYTPDGGEVIFSVFLNELESILEISLQDNGIGIDKEQLEKIFEPFNNTGPSPFHGHSSGIGLSLTKKLIEFLGGTITITSNVNAGTKVFITLPYIKSSVLPDFDQKIQYSAGENDQAIEYQSIDSNKSTVLIIEDNQDVQAYLNNELAKKYIIVQEYNGKKGLKTAVQLIPDLIISDVMMPEMEGTELCRALKLNESTCHIPIIMLTAKSANENQIESYELGAEAYVLKPFSIDVLKAQIKSVLKNRTILQERLSKIKSINDIQKESPGLDRIFLEKISDLIRSHIEETDFNAELLAQKLKISQRQLYRKIKAVSGSTVHEFIIKVKMDYAVGLLKENELSISQIAYKVGFSEGSNFSRTFSKHFGCSPTQFIKQ